MKFVVLKDGKFVPEEPPKDERTFWQKVKDFFADFDLSSDDDDWFDFDFGDFDHHD